LVQTYICTPVIHGRNGLTYTPLDKATGIAEVYDDQFCPDPEEQTFEDFYRLFRTEFSTHLQTQPADPTASVTPNKISRIMKHMPKRKVPSHDSTRNIDLRNLPLNAITLLTKIVNVAMRQQYFLKT
jgi:hypothetical protein